MAKAANDDYRYETKFVSYEYSHADIIRLLKVHPAFFREIYEARCINNVYFDSEDLLFYHRNKSGVDHRKKVRIRWYGHGNAEVLPVLEYKLKFGAVGKKPQFKLKRANYRSLLRRDELNTLMCDSAVPAVEVEEMKALRPVIVNSYQRRYFLSGNGKFRVTIDYGLQYFSLSQYEDERVFRRPSTVDKTVLELKYARDEVRGAAPIVQAFPFRVTKNSKYVDAVEYVYDCVGGL